MTETVAKLIASDSIPDAPISGGELPLILPL